MLENTQFLMGQDRAGRVSGSVCMVHVVGGGVESSSPTCALQELFITEERAQL